MDFNIYLTIQPKEWEVTNNQIFIKKWLPSKLNLLNFLAEHYDIHYKHLGIINDIKINFSPYKDYNGLTIKQNYDTLRISLFSTLLKTDQEVNI